ncbi:MAG: hypothetical protein Q9M32_00405 [Sulfurimonas sp.]|nr:hypothetical protein [Sulfurimonas sp.]MDQ7061626.1 hypothetical protein [Sulfurimonas sp.]
MKFYNYRRFYETLEYKKPMKAYYDSLQINEDNCTLADVKVS